MERHFERELEELRSNLIRMGSLVDEQIDAACRALFDGDTHLASLVLNGDSDINEMDTLIERHCQRIFALTQPVAVDLRLVMATLNINRDLERLGDIAVNIAERVSPLGPHSTFLRSTRLLEMSRIAQIMVRDSLDSFVNQYPPLAVRVLESDDVVDSLNRNIFYRMVRSMQESQDLIEPAAHILILSRHLERLADHATNIAEEVIFLVDARIVKHQSFANGSFSR